MRNQVHPMWRWVNFILLAAGSLVILSPIWWMIATSLKSMEEIMGMPTFIPKEWHFENYIETWNAAPFSTYAVNSLTITLIAVVANVFANAFIAYGFAKLDFRGKKFWFLVVLGTMMIPGFVTLIPQYVLFAKLHLLNTYYPLILPAFFGSAFNIFLLRQFFMGIPKSYIEAARMEGASHFYIFRKIALPLVTPALATVAIFTFNGVWNDFLGPLLYINDENLYTLQIGLQVFKERSSTQWNYMMAGSLMVLLPVIILFFSFQRFFIEGSNITGQTSVDK